MSGASRRAASSPDSGGRVQCRALRGTRPSALVRGHPSPLHPYHPGGGAHGPGAGQWPRSPAPPHGLPLPAALPGGRDRKSTRLNSSHVKISYAVFCLKKKKITKENSALKQQKNTQQKKK